MTIVQKPFEESGALIVGGTAGVGLETARQLRSAGVRRIVLVGRNRERGEAAAARLYMCAAVLPFMRPRRNGVIINLALDAAKAATPGESVIGAGMAAIVMFTRTLAMESSAMACVRMSSRLHLSRGR